MRHIVRQRAVVIAVALSALAIWAPEAALAQGRTWAGESLAQMVDSARWRFGIFRGNGSFELTNVGYDSDIYYGYFPASVPDYTASAGTQIQLLIPVSKSIVLDIYEFPQYMFYLATEKERAWNNRFRGQVHIALEKLYFQAGAGLADVRNRLSPELDVNIREKTNRLDGLALWQVSRQTSLAVIYEKAEHDYGESVYQGNEIARALNRVEDHLDLNCYIQPGPRTRFFLDGQYGDYDFVDETEPVRDAQSYGIFGGVEFLPKGGEILEATGLEGEISLGYQALDIRDPYYVDGSGLTGQGDISFDLARRTRLRAFFFRGFQFSVFSGVSYYVSTVGGGEITRHLSRRTSIRYNLSYGRVNYPTEAAFPAGPEGFYSEYLTHTGSLELRLSKILGVMCFVTLGHRTLEESGTSRNRNFFGINLIYGRPPARLSVPVRGLAQ